MGLFAKLKQAGRAITGGGADVTLTIPDDVALGTPFTVRVDATIADTDLEIDGVYILVRGVVETEIDPDDHEMLTTDHVNMMEGVASLDEVPDMSDGDEQVGVYEVYEARVDLDTTTTTLKADSKHYWRGEITLPADSTPTSVNETGRHLWYLQAGLDAFGNDPDSDWVEFEVK